MIDYDAVEARAREVRPKLLIAGGSAYPRRIDFARMAEIARDVGAWFMVDMAHIAGLVAGGAHPSPLPHADIVTCTTTKTLRGPRGGMILARDAGWGKKLQSSVFPGVQGSLHTQVLAAKAVCLKEASEPAFRAYARDIVRNAAALAEALAAGGIDVVSGGTDTHVVLLDLSGLGLRGQEAEALLDAVNITSNKNPIPFDVSNPNKWSGLRLGVSAATTRGFGAEDFTFLGRLIARLLSSQEGARERQVASARRDVARLCAAHPIYGA
jgi:glycine hydroxymethyltransferase